MTTTERLQVATADFPAIAARIEQAHDATEARAEQASFDRAGSRREADRALAYASSIASGIFETTHGAVETRPATTLVTLLSGSIVTVQTGDTLWVMDEGRPVRYLPLDPDVDAAGYVTLAGRVATVENGFVAAWGRRNVAEHNLSYVESLFTPQSGGGWNVAAAIRAALAELEGDAGGGRLFIPHEGELLYASNIDLPERVEVYGAGKATALYHDGVYITDPAIGAFNGGEVSYVFGINARNNGAAPAHAGAYLHDMTLVGRSVEDGHREQTHLVTVCGADDFIAERMWGRAYQGDMFSLGGTVYGGATFRNRRVTIRDIVADGVNQQNRHVVSGIVFEDLLIENVRGYNTGRYVEGAPGSMPGMIDIEPDDKAWQRVKRLVVRKCHGENVAGNVGVYALYIRRRDDHRPDQLVFEDLTAVDGVGTLSAFYFGVGSASEGNATRSEDSMGLHLVRPVCSGFKRPLQVFGAAGLTETDALYRDCDDGTLVGFRESGDLAASSRSANIKSIRPRYERVGLTTGSPLTIVDVDGLTLESPTFVDCGLGPNTLGGGGSDLISGQPFTVFRGLVENLRVTNMTVISTGRMNAPPSEADGGEADVATFEMTGTRYVGYSPTGGLVDTEAAIPIVTLQSVLDDAFTRADGALGSADSGQAWSGDAVVAGNALGAPTDGVAYALATASGSEVTAQATILLAPDAGADPYVAIYARTNAALAAYIGARHYASGYVQIVSKEAAGVEVELASTNVGPASGTPVDVALTVMGGHVRYSIDGAVACQARAAVPAGATTDAAVFVRRSATRIQSLTVSRIARL